VSAIIGPPQSYQKDFITTVDDDNARIHFDVGGSDIPVELAAVSLRSLPDCESIESDLQPMQTGEPERDGASSTGNG
jgi:hypothetical protein